MVSDETSVDSSGILEGSREGRMLKRPTFDSSAKGRHRQTAPVKRAHHRSSVRNHPVKLSQHEYDQTVRNTCFHGSVGIRGVPDFSWADR